MYINNTPLKPIRLMLSSDNYTSKIDNYENYYYELNYPIMKYNNIDTLITMENFIFTNSMYNINTSNNNFYYSFVYNGVINRVIIAPGNYNIDQLITYLNNACVDKLIFSYDIFTLKINIRSADLQEYPGFKLISNNLTNLIYKIIGFKENQTDANLYESITAPYMFNLNSNVSLNIICDNLKLKTNGVKGMPFYSTLSNIPICSSFGEIQTFINNTSNFNYIVDQDIITSINLNILNQDYKNVDFNNIKWYCSITFNFVYKTELLLPNNFYFNENDIYYNKLRDDLLEYEKNKILNDKK